MKEGKMKYPYAPKGDNRTIKWGYEKEAREMLKIIKDGMTIYDIGANIGDHSIYFALNADVSVYSFEPVPEYFNLAKKNIDHFNASGIKIYNIGISDSKGILKIEKDNEGSSFLESRKDEKAIDVKVETIDNLIKSGFPIPDIIKIDIEGWAEFAFKGAIKTLKSYKPIIILEPHPIFLSVDQLRSKFEIIEDIGYRVTSTLFNKKREFILEVKDGKTFNDFEAFFTMWILRDKYDASTSKSEIKQLQKDYKNLLSRRKVSLFQRLIWSKLYRLFTGKWLKTK